jgi:flagella basal body P-ring formation protein FlgA
LIKSSRYLPKNITISSPEKVYVKRLSQTLRTKDLKGTVYRYLQKKVNSDHIEFHMLRVTGLEPYPLGDIRYRIQDRKIKEKMRFSVEIIVNGNKVDTIYIKVSLKILKNIICAAEKIMKGDIITQQNLKRVRKNILKIPGVYVLEEKNIIGQVAKKQIDQGTVVLMKDFKEPLQIHKGDLVTIFFENDLVQIKTVGTALENGVHNEIIKVMIKHSNKQAFGIILGKSRVKLIK